MSRIPYISIVIAARPDEKDVLAAVAAKRLDYPKDRMEVILARGRQPSVQRNLAVREAKGEFVYFLDDDSVPDSLNLTRVLGLLCEIDVVGVGGPNLCPADSPPVEQAFAAVMGNKVAFGPSAARYRPVGQLRASGEKELILCNLILKRAAFLDAGGFDEQLYPNEENALMDVLIQRGGRLIYDPDFVVRRRPRRDWRAFARMVFNYGRGRAEQLRRHPSSNSVLNFAPPILCVYLCVMPFLPVWGLIPLLIYFPLTLAGAIWTPRHETAGLIWVWLGLMLTHLSYGTGFWRGLFTPFKGMPDEVRRQVILERPVL